MKRKLLLAALCVVSAIGGGNFLHAQTDVTSTYITNPGFEGEYTRFLTINSDRGVEKPVGWSVEWTQSATNDQNGMTYVGSMTQDNTTWSAYEGDKAYLTRMRWANATLNLRQTMKNLRPGSYTLSFYATASKLSSGDGSASVSVAGQSQAITVGTSETTNWTQYTINFTVTTNPYATIEVTASRTGGNFKFGIDDFTLTYDGSSYYSTILTAAQSLYDDNVDWAEGADALNTAITAATGKETVADKNAAIVALEEAMATFKEANTVDMTSKIINPNFDSNISGWTTTGGDGNDYQRQTSSQTNFDGGFLEKWRNGWNGGYNQKNFDVYQTLSNLPNGEYTIKAAIIAVMQGSAETFSANNTAYSNKKHGGPYYIDDEKGVWLYGNSDENSGKAWANTKNSNFDGDGAEYKTATVKVENGSLTIGFKGIGSVSGGTSLGTYANWIACDNWTLSYFGFDPTTLLAQITSLKEQATDLLANDDYRNVVGTEKSALTTASTLEPADEKKSTLEAAISQIETAIANFTAAKTNYDALVAEIAKAKDLGIDTETAESYATTATTAEQALTNTQALKVAEYTFITTTYTESATLGAWTETFPEDLTNEGYVANGPTYFNEWGSDTRTAKQTITLPAGDYAVSCIGRGAVGTSGYLYYKIGDAEAVTTDFNMKGNRGRGVDTSGAANFSDNGTYTCNNEGFGWEYRFLTFTLSEETAVEIGVSATFANNWVSIYAPQLRTTEASVKALRLTEISTAIGNVPTGKMNATVQSTLNTKKVAAQGASDSNTLGELNTILSELNAAIEAANTSIAAYASVKAAIDEAEAVILTGSTLDLSTYEDAYDNGSMLDAEAATTVDNIKAALKTALFSQTLIADVTALMTNPSFENGTTGWNEQHSATNNTVSWNSEANEAAPDGNKILNMTTSNGYFTGFAIDQPVTLPAGYYRLTANVKSTNVDVDTYIFASTNTHWSGKGMATIGTAKVETANTWESLATEFYVDAEKTIYLGVTTESGNWSGATYANYQADNFKLYYMGNAITKISSENLEGYKTFYNADVNYQVDDNTTIYKATSDHGTSVTITEVNGKVIPADTPVIVKSTADADANNKINITFTPTTAGTEDSFTDNILAVAGGGETNKYILGYLPGEGNGLGFYKYTSPLNAGDVYLNVSGSGAKGRIAIVEDGEATGIGSLDAEGAEAKGAIYNVAGQRVGAGYKGIVIKNGKKYMNK